ncbi:MAG: DNA primase [Catonella sp.]|uniref:DNA primase n=1 Tax=Catonella sp. TaxID=2382125 RepID=UPI003F9EE80B
MYYSEEIVDEVREKNDIVDVISRHVNLTRRGSNYVGLCPFHGEKTPSFSVNQSKQIFHCFGCGVGGNCISFIMKYDNLSFTEAVKELADRVGMVLPEETEYSNGKKKADLRIRMLEIYKEAATFYYYHLRGDYGKYPMDYLKNRGLSDETIHKFGLGYSVKSYNALYTYLKSKGYSDELMIKSELVTFKEGRGVFDMFWNRVMFPIMDQNNRVIAFGGRVMGEGEPKYLNSRETDIFNKRRNLYGLNFAKHSREKYMLLCEGYMDVIALHQEGFTNAVASLGTALTEEQARLIARYVKEVVITYDSDGAGVKAALRAIPILKAAGIKTKILKLTPYKDPDELIKAAGREEFEKRIENAENSFDFELLTMEQSFNLSEPEGKTEFLNKVAERLTDFHEDLERENYIAAVAEKYFISKESLNRLVIKIGGAKEIREVYKEAGERTKKAERAKTAEEGMLKTGRLLLSLIYNRPSLYNRIKDIILPEDFVVPLYKDVAGRMFRIIDNGGVVNVAEMISRYESADDQALVTEIFEDKFDLSFVKNEQEKVFREVVIKVKRAGLDEMLRQLDDNDMKNLMEIKRKQNELSRLKF